MPWITELSMLLGAGRSPGGFIPDVPARARSCPRLYAPAVPQLGCVPAG
jgi:hypothetical protein